MLFDEARLTHAMVNCLECHQADSLSRSSLTERISGILGLSVHWKQQWGVKEDLWWRQESEQSLTLPVLNEMMRQRDTIAEIPASWTSRWFPK